MQAAGADVRAETIKLLHNKGPKLDRVLLRLRQSLNAKETKVIKLKGAIGKNELPKGFDLIVNTGSLITSKDGEVFGDGESLIRYDVISHSPRLRAIDLALQLHDAMPGQKHEHSGKIDLNAGTLNAIISALPDELAKSVSDRLMELISSK